jgi:hypothetical protein
MSQRREIYKPKIYEARLENHVGGDVEFNRALPEREFVKKCRAAMANQLLVW